MRVVISPLMAPRFLPVRLDAVPCKAIILTSQTGAEAAARMKADLPDLAFCVGDRTAEAARAAGFAVQSAQGDAEDLLRLILGQSRGPMVHLRGREARGDLARRLSAAGVPTTEIVVYAQEEQPLTEEAMALLTGSAPVVVPLFSPRSAEILGAFCQTIAALAPLTVIAMSPAVAAVARYAAGPPRIARHPDGESMLDEVVAQLVAAQGA